MPIRPLSHRPRRRHLRAIGFNPGECPALDSTFTNCLLNGTQMPCSYIRECDAYTGAVHFEYALPYGSTNENIWQISGDSAVWVGSEPAPTSTPVFPDYVADAITFGNQQTTDPNAYSVPVVTQSQYDAAQTAAQQAAADAAAQAAAQAAADYAAKQAAKQAAQQAAQQAAADYAAQQAAQQQNDRQAQGSETGLEQFWKTLNIGSGTPGAAVKNVLSNPADTLKAVPVWAWAAAAAGLYLMNRQNARRR